MGTHEADYNWNFWAFVKYLKRYYVISSRELYWKVWAIQHLFKCDLCGSHYRLSEIRNCHQNEDQVTQLHLISRTGFQDIG